VVAVAEESGGTLMAVLSASEKVSLLTSFYQVDPAKGDLTDENNELIRWLKNFAGGGGLPPMNEKEVETLQRLAALHVAVKNIMDSMADQGEIFAPDFNLLQAVSKEIREPAKSFSLAYERPIVRWHTKEWPDGTTDRFPIREGEEDADAKTLDDNRELKRLPGGVTWIRGPETYIKPQQVHMAKHISLDYDMGRTADLVNLLVSALKRTPEAFRRCEECRNVYVAMKKEGQRYCSHRCIARVATRRRRRAEKREVVDPVLA